MPLFFNEYVFNLDISVDMKMAEAGGGSERLATVSWSIEEDVR